MRLAVSLILLAPAWFAPAVFAQDGASMYKERCAMCHDSPQERTPSLSAIKAMSGEEIYAALTTGAMKSRAEGLSTADLIALITYIAPTGAAKAAPVSLTPTCKGDNTFRLSANTPQWNGWSTNPTNSRFENAASAGIAASDVPKLKLKWAFNLGDASMARAQPVIAGGRIFTGSQNTVLYSLDAKTGCTWWAFQSESGIRAGATLGDANGAPAVFFSDGGGTIHALNASNGALLWKLHPVDETGAIATGGPRYDKGVVYQPYSSYLEALAPDPKFQCCQFRGVVVAVDATTGKEIWRTYTIPDEPKLSNNIYGPSGAAVWSTPTIDEQKGAIYVATGDNYSDPPTDTSDAVLALDLKTGKLLWSKQFTKDDTYNNGCGTPQKTNCPGNKGPDYDFGQPPILVSLGGGKRALVIAQKSGMVHAIDPDRKGEILWETRAGEGSALGGSEWGSAADATNMYVAISNIGIGGVADPKSPAGYRMVLDPKKGGGLYALDLKTGKIVWSAKPAPCAADRTDCSPAQSAAVSGIPGAVFSGSVDGHLRAYSTKTGTVIWDEDTEREFPAVNGKPAHGGSMDAAGPAIAGGLVVVNSGYGQWGGMPGNALLVYSVEGK